MTENKENNPKSSKKETIGFVSAIVVMLIAIGLVWQVFLKGKIMEDSANDKDTVVQVKVDTIRIKDSLNRINKTNNPTDNNTGEIKSASEKDTTRFNRLKDSVKSKISNTDPKELSTEEKKKLKDEFKKLPPKKQDRIKRKLKSDLNK